MNHLSPTPAEIDAMTYADALAHARRELAELPPGSPHAEQMAEAFGDLLFQKRTGIPGILRSIVEAS